MVAVGADKALFSLMRKQLIDDRYRFEFIEKDIYNSEGANQLVRRVCDKSGSIDILVNNAGYSNRSTIVSA